MDSDVGSTTPFEDPQLEELNRLKERYARLAEEGARADVLGILSAAIIERAVFFLGRGEING